MKQEWQLKRWWCNAAPVWHRSLGVCGWHLTTAPGGPSCVTVTEKRRDCSGHRDVPRTGPTVSEVAVLFPKVQPADNSRFIFKKIRKTCLQKRPRPSSGCTGDSLRAKINKAKTLSLSDCQLTKPFSFIKTQLSDRSVPLWQINWNLIDSL